jgi:hypothetical protein
LYPIIPPVSKLSGHHDVPYQSVIQILIFNCLDLIHNICSCFIVQATNCSFKYCIAKVKLGLIADVDTIVLEEDEILLEVSNKVLLVLTEGQAYVPQCLSGTSTTSLKTVGHDKPQELLDLTLPNTLNTSVEGQEKTSSGKNKNFF